jgi:hypothetical protein
VGRADAGHRPESRTVRRCGNISRRAN